MSHRLTQALCNGDLLDKAFDRLCRCRKHFPPNADIWDFRRQWPHYKTQLQAELKSGRFQFEPQTRITRANGQVEALCLSA